MIAASTDSPTARNAQAEATARAGDDYVARVLEPSPPADTDEQWFADDPTARGEVPTGRRIVSPVTSGDVTWQELAEGDGEIAGWCADRWLASWRQLERLPSTFVETRHALHLFGAFVISQARKAANTKFGLRFTFDGFGTPFYAGLGGVDAQARVQGTFLVLQEGEGVTTAPITSLSAAADVCGLTVDPAAWEGFEVPDPGDLDEALVVDAASARALADWFGFAYSVLEELRSRTEPAQQPSRVQLWPEHFDPAFEAGEEAAGRRAAFGASPGDAIYPEPYLYVAPWSSDEVPASEYWSASFGAVVLYSELVGAADQRTAALDFYEEGRRILTS